MVQLAHGRLGRIAATTWRDMVRRGFPLVALAATGLLAAGGSANAAAEWFSASGQVTRIVDGDTIDVRVSSRIERVRLIGIDAPERGACYSTQATVGLRGLVFKKRVRLQGDRSQTRRDRYGRLLAYVTLGNGSDVGRRLLQQGLATVYETRPPFARRSSYLAESSRASGAGTGLWSGCGSPPAPIAAPPQAKCDPSYPDVCIPPPPPDLDCGQITHRRFRVIRTTATPDPHRFDGDRDGIGCES